MTTVTQWFGGDVKPEYEGQYLRDYYNGENGCLDYWDGKVWRYFKNGMPCKNQCRKWRGLAENPNKAKQKKAKP